MCEMKPIIFNTEMIQAILENRKSQTRRVIKPQPKSDGIGIWHYQGEMFGSDESMQSHLLHDVYGDKGSPYGSAYHDGGDKLWARERYAFLEHFDHLPPREVPTFAEVQYFATDEETMLRGKWRPSIHMPKWASRITLEIKDVRVERVQDITFEDCVTEGIAKYTGARGILSENPPDQRWKFIELWDSINLKRGFGWDTNPWVWIVEFKKIDQHQLYSEKESA